MGSGTSPLEQKHGEGIDAVLTECFSVLHGGGDAKAAAIFFHG
jgi:hypothetical protein